MTRKRLKKLLMSMNVDRKAIDAILNRPHSLGIDYYRKCTPEHSDSINLHKFNSALLSIIYAINNKETGLKYEILSNVLYLDFSSKEPSADFLNYIRSNTNTPLTLDNEYDNEYTHAVLVCKDYCEEYGLSDIPQMLYSIKHIPNKYKKEKKVYLRLKR